MKKKLQKTKKKQVSGFMILMKYVKYMKLYLKYKRREFILEQGACGTFKNTIYKHMALNQIDSGLNLDSAMSSFGNFG